MLADGVRTVLIRMLAVALSAALAIIIGRELGPHGRGLYVLPGMLAVLGSVAFSGLKTVVSRTMLRTGEHKGAVRAALLSCIPLGAIAAVGVMIIAAFLQQLWAVPYALAALPFMAMTAIASGYGYGLQQVRIPNAVNAVIPAIAIVFVCSAFWLKGPASNVAIAMWLAAYVLAGGVAIAAVLVHVRKEPKTSVPFLPFLSYALRLSGLYVMQLLNYRIDLYIVAYLTSITALGIYGVAVSGAEAMLTVTAVTEIVSLSRVGSLPREQAASLTAKCLRNNLILSTVTCAIAMVVAPYAVTLLYGRAFAPAILPLQILLIGIVAISLVSVLTNYYTVATGKAMVPFVMQAASTVTCAAMSFWLIPTLGITGAAIATTSSYLLTISAALIWFAYESQLPMRSVILAGKADVEALLAASMQLWTKEKALKRS